MRHDGAPDAAQRTLQTAAAAPETLEEPLGPGGLPGWLVELPLHRSPQVMRLAAAFVARRAVRAGAALRLVFTAPTPPANQILRFPALPLAEFRDVATVGVDLPRLQPGSAWWYPATSSTIVLPAPQAQPHPQVLPLLQAVVDTEHCAAESRVLHLDARTTTQAVEELVLEHSAQAVSELLEASDRQMTIVPI